MRYVFPSRETLPAFERLRPEIRLLSATATRLEYLRAAAGPAAPVGVDEKNRIIRGVVLGQVGPFFSGRGEFDGDSLKAVAKLTNANPSGTKSRYGHPDPDHPGGPGKLDGFLGRVKNVYSDGDKARGDLHLDPTAFLAPPGGGTSRGDYLMARAKSDPSSFAMSLVLAADKEFRMDNHNKPRRDRNGEVLPPIWRPTEIHAVDVVDHGDSTPDGLLAAGYCGTAGDELLRLRHDWRRRKLRAGV